MSANTITEGHDSIRHVPPTSHHHERINRETAFFSLYTGTILILVVILLSIPQSSKTVVPHQLQTIELKKREIHSTSFDISTDGGIEALAQFLSSHDRHARCYVTAKGSLRSALKKSFEYTKKFESLIPLNVIPRDPLVKFIAVPISKADQLLPQGVLCQIED